MGERWVVGSSIVPRKHQIKPKCLYFNELCSGSRCTSSCYQGSLVAFTEMVSLYPSSSFVACFLLEFDAAPSVDCQDFPARWQMEAYK